MDVYAYGVQLRATSLVQRWKLESSVTNQGLTGLTNASAGLVISTIGLVEDTAVPYTQAAGDIESITTLGLYEAPTPGKCRFREVDATNHPGIYEFQFEDTRTEPGPGGSAIGSYNLLISVHGAANLKQADFVMPLANAGPDEIIQQTVTLVESAVTGAVDEGLSHFLPVHPAKGSALSNFQFQMLLTNGMPAIGLEVFAELSKNGGNFNGTSNDPEEIDGGWYSIDLTSTEMNADTVAVRFLTDPLITRQTGVTFITQKQVFV